MKVLTTLASILTLLPGCVSNPSYPTSWDTVLDEKKCPRIDGKYLNSGVDHTGREINLSSFLFRTDNVKADYVRFTTTNNKVTIDVFNDGELVINHIENINNDYCEDQQVEFDLPETEGGVNRGGVLGYTWESALFSKNEGDDFLIHHNSSAIGIVYIIPIIGSAWSWIKFTEIK